MSGRKRSPSTVNGTYHWRVTEAGAHAAARAVGASPHADDEDLGAVGKMTLRDGKWLMGDTDPEDYSGTYEIVGNRLVFDWQARSSPSSSPATPTGRSSSEPLPPMSRRRGRVGRGTLAARGPARARHSLTRGQGI